MKANPLYNSLIIFLTYSMLLLVYAFEKLAFPKIIGYWFIGFFVFTLIEYIFHRWLFHMHAGSARKSKLQYAIHGNHHSTPHQMTELMIKPAMAVVILVLTSGLFFWLFSLNALALLPGFLCGYSCYLAVHFAIHAFRPPQNFLRILWKHHKLHHFFDDRSNFGVSSPLWDLVFGTYSPGKRSTKKNKNRCLSRQ